MNDPDNTTAKTSMPEDTVHRTKLPEQNTAFRTGVQERAERYPDNPNGNSDRTMTMSDEQINSISKTATTIHTQTSFILSSLGLFTEQRDVNKAIESSHSHMTRDAVTIDGNESAKLELLQDKYEKGNVFAEGGQGILCEGTDRNLRRLVAIKSLRKQYTEDPKLRSLFISEAKVTAQLDHPSIIPIYSLNKDDDNGLALTMKLVDGQTLKSYLAQIRSNYRLDGIGAFNEKESLRFRLEIFLNVCNGIEYAHSRNVMHCDLKPENIIIGEFHETYIMDWGIAHLIRGPGYDPDNWVKPERISGTPRFLPPETIAGLYCDQRADLFTLGLILFEVVTLQEAYFGNSSEEVIAMIRDDRMAPIEHRFKYKIDGDLKAIIRKATEHDPNRRYNSVKEFADDLRRYLDNQAIQAKPDKLPRKILRYSMHHQKTTVGILLAVALFAIAGIVYSLNREINHIIKIKEKEESLERFYTNSAKAAHLLDEQITNHSKILSVITSSLLFLLENQQVDFHQSHKNFRPYQDFLCGTPEPGESMRFSKVYLRNVDFSAMAYKGKRNDVRIRKLSVLQPRLLKRIQQELPAAVQRKSFSEQMDYVRDVGVPFHLCCIGFEKDGFFIVYPGNGNYLDNYDPRERPWYTRANESDGNIVWSKPYAGNTREAGYLLSCSSAIVDSNGKKHGVANIDILLSVVARNLADCGNKGKYLISKTLIDEDGDILISVGSEKQENAQASILTVPYENKTVLEQAQQLKFGVHQVKENGKEIIYCFNYLASTNWYYIEKIDFTQYKLENH